MPLSRNLGTLTGPVQACNGTALHFTLHKGYDDDDDDNNNNNNNNMQYAALISGDSEEYVLCKMGTAIPTPTYLPLSFAKLKSKRVKSTLQQTKKAQRRVEV